jgi:hypothetical protein
VTVACWLGYLPKRAKELLAEIFTLEDQIMIARRLLKSRNYVERHMAIQDWPILEQKIRFRRAELNEVIHEQWWAL